MSQPSHSRKRLVATLATAAALLALTAHPTIRNQAKPIFDRVVSGGDCEPCSPSDPICAKWGYDAVAKSRGYMGTGHGLEPFISKLRRGDPVTIGVLGGSVSACHEVSNSECYHSVLARDMGANVTVHNGGLGAAGSQFFSACWNLMVTGDEDVILIEFGVNDSPFELINRSTAFLIQSLLSLPKRPALLIVDLFSPVFDTWYEAGVSINALAQYYDIPVVSHRAVLYNWRKRNPDRVDRFWIKNQYFPTGHHPTVEGHALVSDMILSLLKERSCIQRRAGVQPQGEAFAAGGLDNVLSWMPWHKLNESLSETDAAPGAWCQSASPGPFELTLAPSSSGFSVANWKDKTYLVGSSVGDVAVLKHGMVHDVIRIFYWRSRTVGLGTAQCSVKGDDRPHRLDGCWDSGINGPDEYVLVLGDEWIGRQAELECRVVEHAPRPDGVKDGNEFRIAAVAW